MEFLITHQEDGHTVKQFIYETLNLSTRLLKRLKYRCNGHGITVNGAPVNVLHVLRQGELLRLSLEDQNSSAGIVPNGTMPPVLYEDEDLLILNKPPYMPTHPTHGHLCDTAANAVAAYYAAKGIPFVFRCGSRLDRDTSGVLPIAKNQQTASWFYRCHTNGTMQKYYLALLGGALLPPAGRINLPIARQNDSVIMRAAVPGGAPAATTYQTLWHAPAPTPLLSAVLAIPYTGRTHQLRVHFAACGCPIIGDSLYGTANGKITRQALHAVALRFPHPRTHQPLSVFAPIPADIIALLKQHNADVQAIQTCCQNALKGELQIWENSSDNCVGTAAPMP